VVHRQDRSSINAKACASKLEQMKRVALSAIVCGSGKREGKRNNFRASAHACARSYSPPIRLTTHSARRDRSFSFSPVGRNTRTCNPFSSERRTDLTPPAMSASTMHRGQAPLQATTYIDT